MRLEKEIEKGLWPILNKWVWRLINLGQIDDACGAKGGFTVFRCHEVEDFVEKLFRSWALDIVKLCRTKVVGEDDTIRQRVCDEMEHWIEEVGK